MRFLNTDQIFKHFNDADAIYIAGLSPEAELVRN